MAIPQTPSIKNTTTGWASPSQLAVIEHFAKHVPENGIIVEIGSFAGRSAWHWAKACPTATVYAVDSWDTTVYSKYRKRREDLRGTRIDKNIVECTLEDFLLNTRDCSNIVPVKARSPDLPADILEKLSQVDLVYIDDSHKNPEFENNFEFWRQRVKPGGVFCGDDFRVPDVCNVVVQYAMLNKKQLYARSNIWRLYETDENIDLNQTI
jgi:predicted O-methyltransferase YrrM